MTPVSASPASRCAQVAERGDLERVDHVRMHGGISVCVRVVRVWRAEQEPETREKDSRESDTGEWRPTAATPTRDGCEVELQVVRMTGALEGCLTEREDHRPSLETASTLSTPSP